MANIPKNIVLLSLEIDFILANPAEPDTTLAKLWQYLVVCRLISTRSSDGIFVNARHPS